MAIGRELVIQHWIDGIMPNWEACMSCSWGKEKWVVPWSTSPFSMQKFNVDGAARLLEAT